MNVRFLLRHPAIAILLLISSSSYSPASGQVKAANTALSEQEFRSQFGKWTLAYEAANYQEAESILTNMLANIDRNQPKYKAYLGQTLSNLIKTEFALRKYSEAKPLYERMIQLVSAQYGPKSIEMAKTLRSYSLVYRRLGEQNKALELQKQADLIMMHPVALGPGPINFNPVYPGAGKAPVKTPGSAAQPIATAAQGKASTVSAGSEASVTELPEASFDSSVLSSDLPVLVDFYADWCGPCRRMAPVVAATASAYSGRLVVYKINVDNAKNLSAKFKINSIPRFMVFKSGQVVASHNGTMSQDEMNKLVDQAM